MNKMLLKRIATVVLAGIVTAETVLSGCLVIATADAESAYSAEDSMTWKLDQIEPDMNCINNVVIMEGPEFLEEQQTAEGIQLQWSYKADFSNATNVYPSRITSYIVKVKSPKAGKTMYCRVRGYVTKDGRRIYGDWSDTNSLKIVKLKKPEGFTASNVKSQTIRTSWKAVKCKAGMKVRYVVKVNVGKEEFFWTTNKTSETIKDKAFKKGVKITMSVAAYVHPKNTVYAEHANPRYWYGFNMMYSKSKKITIRK